MKKPNLDKKIAFGALAIMFAALLWSIDGVFIRPKFYTLSAPLVVFLEHLLGFIVLSPFIILGWKKIKMLNKKTWIAIFWVCVFGGVLGTIMITKAFFAAVAGETTFSTVIILQKLQPIFALILARLILREKLSKNFYIWALLGIIAAYFLAFGKTGLNLSELNLLHNAAFFAIIAAFSFGSSTVFGKRIVNHLDFKLTTALRFGITGIMVFILILFTGDIAKITELTALHWQLLALIVFTSGAGAMFIYYFGLRRVTASTATIAELFWPFSAVILDYIINKNVLNTTQIIAALILLIAFYKVVSQGKVKNITFKAKVMKGAGRGKNLGFPTANLDQENLDISHGVYLAETKINNQTHQGLLHFGYKETFNEKPSLELHIKNFSQDILGQEIEVKIIKKIRDIKKFKSVDELKEQIQKDINSTK
ncbi:EamA family transporter [Candidatus Falkowbacteria bacterium]|nr:EamA family transporter [Candidatus Falkowbacteria bacterium]